MTGGVRDRSPDGARAMLSRAADGVKSREIRWHPLFSAEYYDAVNPDIAAAGVSPWLHYHVHGRAEGRSPHPLIDSEFLAVSVSEVLRSEVIDRYLTSPRLWVFDTSPYVDCQKFVLSGNWDGVSNPLTQIVTHYLDSQWVRKRLMLVDSPSPSAARARMIGSTVLLTRNHPGSQFAPISIWAPRSGAIQPSGEKTAAEYTVVPGFFLGSRGKEVASHDGVRISPDSTVIRLVTEFLSVGSGRSVSSENLVYLTGPCVRGYLSEIVDSMDGPTFISPDSAAQALALAQVLETRDAPHIEVLPYGVQVKVRSMRAVVESPPAPSPLPVWSWSRSERSGDIAIVLSQQHSRRASADDRLSCLLSEGASLCIVDETNVSTWLPILQNRPFILVERALVELIECIVEDAALFVLPSSEVGNQS